MRYLFQDLNYCRGICFVCDCIHVRYVKCIVLEIKHISTLSYHDDNTLISKFVHVFRKCWSSTSIYTSCIYHQSDRYVLTTTVSRFASHSPTVSTSACVCEHDCVSARRCVTTIWWHPSATGKNDSCVWQVTGSEHLPHRTLPPRKEMNLHWSLAASVGDLLIILIRRILGSGRHGRTPR